MFIYIITIIFILFFSILLLHLRLKFELNPDQKNLYFTLGRSGFKIDFISKQMQLLIFNFQTKSFPFKKSEEKKPEKKSKVKKEKTKKKKRKLPGFSEIWNILPQTTKAIFNFSVSLFKSVIVEELNGTVNAGLFSPDQTGRLYGYYSAFAGAVPAIGNRLYFNPVWDEAHLSGSVKGSFSLPLYKLIGRTILLFFRLPLREIIKMSKNSMKGGHDGQ